MKRKLDDKIYSDRELKCRCGRHIADVRMQGQVLVIGSLVCFNALFWRCLECNRASSYLAPTLPDEKPTLDNQYPDVSHLERRANKISGTTKTTDKSRLKPGYGIYKNKNRWSVRIEGKHIGSSTDKAEALRMRDAALLEQKAEELGYRLQEKQSDKNFYQQNAAT